MSFRLVSERELLKSVVNLDVFFSPELTVDNTRLALEPLSFTTIVRMYTFMMIKPSLV